MIVGKSPVVFEQVLWLCSPGTFDYVLVLWNRTCPLARFLGVFVIAVKVLWYRTCPLARFLGGFKADLLTWL